VDETSLNKSQKFIRILEAVTQPGGASVNDLIDRFGIDARTLRRYLADLRACGLPIVDESRDGDRILCVESRWARATVQLSLAEVLSLHFGRTLFTFLEGTTFASDMRDAIERLQPVVGREDAERTRNLDRKFMAVAEHAKDYAADGDLLDEIISALLFGNPADAEYAPLTRGIGRIYRLEPLTLAVYRQGLYLFARDVNEDKVKTFAVERFARFSRLRRERFAYPDDFDPRAHIQHAFGITGGDPVDVAATFTHEVSPYVRERRWHASQRVEVLPNGDVRLRLRVANTAELREWLLGFGADVRVEAPPELVESVRIAHMRAAALYATHPGSAGG
jgi:predicted DNA-binding transcriptional regulator YafY